jgi:DNA-binding CsgD family transcriptional regulator
VGNTYGIAWSLFDLACYALFGSGDLVQAQVWAEESLALFRDIGTRSFEPIALAALGEIRFYQGDITSARLLLEQSCTRYRELGNEVQTAWTLFLIGKVLAAEGELAAARAVCEESLLLEIRLNAGQSFTDIPPALESLAAVVAVQGELTWAARLWGKAEAERETIRMPLPPRYRAEYEQAVALARTGLDESFFMAAWAEGRGMTLEHVFEARGPVTMPALPSETPLLKKSVSSYSDRLTTREVDVLKLLAEGLTNVQIAERLVIGVAIVNSHVRSIYSKLGVSSRSAVTRYALEHHLT